MLACVYCLSKEKVCSLEPLLDEQLCKADVDRDLEEVGTAEMLTSMANVVLIAEDLEAMEGVQVAEETEGSIITGMPEGELTEGLTWQVEQHEQEHRQATADCVMPSAKVTVEEAPENDLDVQEVFGLVIPELGTFSQPG